jgi:plasmid maintenance system antidote protein VapI
MATKNTMSEILRQAIINSGLPLLRIEQDTGVQRASISRFVRGERSLRLDLADKLAAYFGLELTLAGTNPSKKSVKE